MSLARLLAILTTLAVVSPSPAPSQPSPSTSDMNSTGSVSEMASTSVPSVASSGQKVSVSSFSSIGGSSTSGIKLGGSIPASTSSAPPSSSASASQSAGASASTTGVISSFPGDTQSITSSAGPGSDSSVASTSSAPAGQASASPPPQKLNNPSVTSTITEQAQSTFSQAVSVTITNASGQLSVTVPPLVTSIGTTTGSDGALVTYTHVIANPPGWNSSPSSSGNSFFNNHGAVAGTFVVVGIVAAALFGCLYAAFVRHRRQRKRDQLRSSITWPVNDPRGGLFDQHPMHTSGVPSFAPSSPSLYPSSLLPAEEGKPNDHLAGDASPQSPTVPLSPPPRPPRSLRPPISVENLVNISSAFSDDSSLASRPPSVVFRSPSAPPRPPRARPPMLPEEPQRRLSKLSQDYRPVTPPTSVSSLHDSSEPSSPVPEVAAPVGTESTQLQRGASLLPHRRTLLDVRTVPRQS
ncbi:hypothetical protein BV22DRAFT_454503 [Leucogyrophana mollusca]|uniref:Uncharacterized protein n=1 Tax=Leucogyrophana mollusca TaxID=85980 RepID=A0ACB8BK25_9AGAM|nr:hypothetical protein BV22DRAFT_454503 [Leucogyrophana mollusca]